jgi:glucose-1-phosphate cytidylyltransferase
MVTYGDAVGDIDLKALLAEHNKSGKLGTMSVYNFGQSKGVIDLGEDGNVNAFREKSDLDGDLINIGFMVFEPQIFDYLRDADDNTAFENEPLNNLIADKQLMGYIHRGYWQCMDTKREKDKIEALWESGHAPWKTWED